ncbi:MAG: hypothetical protein ACREOM_07060 [Candidatus Dormibacteraceae bacterium]
MRGKGITYDAGFINAGTISHQRFDPHIVGREMRIIHDDLHCTAVRITGGDPDRLEIAATLAAKAGLEVWFSPSAAIRSGRRRRQAAVRPFRSGRSEYVPAGRRSIGLPVRRNRAGRPRR